MTELVKTEVLLEAAQQVLETMFFTSVMGDRDAPPESPCVDARVAFHGAPSGVFGIRLSAPAARTITGNFLGAEDESEVTEAQIGEVVCEMTNMLCGAVLSKVESESTFDIAKPELAPAPTGWTRSLDLDSGALMLALSLEEAK
jgi:CheY-specific phosphatase CheX